MPNSISKQIFVLLIRSPYRQTISSPSDIATGRPLLRRTENADERDLGDKETEVYNLLTAQQESLLDVGPAPIAVTMQNCCWRNGEIYPLVGRVPQSVCGFSRIFIVQRATFLNRILIAVQEARKGS
jgi:hypothetical protein